VYDLETAIPQTRSAVDIRPDSRAFRRPLTPDRHRFVIIRVLYAL